MTSPATARPRIFVSSTIHDFGDLRDALRFWLEEMGFDVQMSEHTDFERRPEAGTFEACFESIRSSDFYVLLIGKRRGTWYDEPNRVSVTMQEYRVARESFESSGGPRIIAAVRSDVITVLGERRALGSPEGGSTLDDWRLTEHFIQEVRREGDVAEAAAKGEGYPPNNWLASFRDFRELTNILRQTLAITGPLQRAAILETVRQDCEDNLRALLTNHKGAPFYQHWRLDSVRRETVLRPDDIGHSPGMLQLDYETLKRAVGFLVAIPSPNRFTRLALDEAVASGMLLDWDRNRRGWAASPVLSAIYQLREQLDIYLGRHDFLRQYQDALSVAWEEVRNTRSLASVPALPLLALYGVHDSLQNIGSLLVGILRHLYGHTSEVEFSLRPRSPIPEFEEELRRETVSPEQLQGWLEKDNFLLRHGAREQTEEQRKQQEQWERRIRGALGDEEFERLMSEA